MTYLKEAKIILPTHDNAQQSVQHVIDETCKRLAARFGGFTVTEGRGGWVDGAGNLITEPVAIITVATDDTLESQAYIQELARKAGKSARQDAVYFQQSNGFVHIETLEGEPAQ